MYQALLHTARSESMPIAFILWSVLQAAQEAAAKAAAKADAKAAAALQVTITNTITVTAALVWVARMTFAHAVRAAQEPERIKTQQQVRPASPGTTVCSSWGSSCWRLPCSMSSQ